MDTFLGNAAVVVLNGLDFVHSFYLRCNSCHHNHGLCLCVCVNSFLQTVNLPCKTNANVPGRVKKKKDSDVQCQLTCTSLFYLIDCYVFIIYIVIIYL